MTRSERAAILALSARLWKDPETRWISARLRWICWYADNLVKIRELADAMLNGNQGARETYLEFVGGAI